MKLNYKNFEIEVFDDRSYSLNSVENLRPYDKAYFDVKPQGDQFCYSSKYAIFIKEYKIESPVFLFVKLDGQQK